MVRSRREVAPGGPATDSSPHVLFVTESLAIGGAERQALQALEYLQRRGAVCEVAVLGGDGPLAAELARLNVPCHLIPRSGALDLKCLSQLRSLLVDGGFTAVEGLLHFSNVYAMLAGRWAGVPVRVASNVGDRSLFVEEGAWKPRLCKRIAYRHATAILANSRFVAHADPQMQKWSHKVHVIHNGLRDEMFAEPGSLGRPADLPTERPTVGMVGRLVEAKDYPTFLRMIAKLRDDLPDVLGVAVGGGPLEEPLRQLSSELGITENVHFAGMVDDPRPWLHAFDVFVLTSSRESLPNALMEAMAAGCPVVATRAAGIPELVLEGETGSTCPVGDIDGMAQAAACFLKDGELRGRMGSRAREHALKSWRWEQQIVPYLAMLSAQQPGAIPT